jgi:cytoskeletal protein CcmA (bactofilin family)
MIVRDAGNVTLNSGATLNKITLGENSTATFNAGSTVTTIQNLSNNAQLTMNNTYSSNLFMNQDSSLTVNGTLNGNFGINSTAMQYVGEAGTVTGEIELNGSDQMTVAGNVTGRFSLNQTSQAFIEATANILSDSGNSWIYNTAAITWNVGADGSIGTLKTSRLEQNAGQFDGEWRYDSSAADMVVDLSAYEADGSSISLQLVSGIQNESAFASNVTFLRDGSDITSDFSYDGTGTFSGVVVPEPGTYALLAGCFALASVMIRRRR